MQTIVVMKYTIQHLIVPRILQDKWGYNRTLKVGILIIFGLWEKNIPNLEEIILNYQRTLLMTRQEIMIVQLFEQ